MLVISRKSNQTLMVGNEIEIRVLGARNDSVKLGIVAPQKIPVVRGELLERVKEQNQAALRLDPTLLMQKGPKRSEIKIPANPGGKCLASWLTHEVRNFLTPIHGELQLALLDCEEGELKQGITTAESQSRALGGWLQKTSTLGKSCTHRSAECELELLLGAELERWSGSAELVIECQQGISMPTTFPGLGCPLTELLRNAEEASADRIKIRATQDDLHTILEIEDNGLGMDRASLEYIKRPYFSTKSHHFGQGFALVRNFVDGFGGELRVESAIDAGTKVTMLLPRAKPTAKPADPRVVLRGRFEGPEQKRLESKGFRVILAETDEQAVRLRERFPDVRFVDPRSVSLETWLANH